MWILLKREKKFMVLLLLTYLQKCMYVFGLGIHCCFGICNHLNSFNFHGVFWPKNFITVTDHLNTSNLHGFFWPKFFITITNHLNSSNLHELFWPKFLSPLQPGGKKKFWGVKIFHDCTFDWGQPGGALGGLRRQNGSEGHVWAARTFAATFVVL